MRKLFIFLLVFAFAVAIFMPDAQAKYDLKKWYLGIYDEDNNLVTDTCTVNVYTIDTTTNATIYSDEDATAKSNPWDVTDGKINFWSSASSLDIQINSGSRGAYVQGITEVSTHRIALATQQVGVQKSLLFTPPMFIDWTTEDLIDADENPSLEVIDSVPCIAWDDGETDKASVTFRVPYDYLSGGSFRVWADEDASLSTTETLGTGIDFEVYVNADVTAFDAAVTNQTPVALDGQAGSPEEIALTVTTDFASLAAGHLVTFNIWREDTTYTEDDDLEIYYVEFIYTAKQ
jgi:hypothetical protein